MWAKVLLLNMSAVFKLDLDRPRFTTGDVMSSQEDVSSGNTTGVDVLSSGNIAPAVPIGEAPKEMLTGPPTLEEVEEVALSVLAGASWCNGSVAPFARCLRASLGSGVAGSSGVLFARRSVTVRPCARDPDAVIFLLKAVNLVDMTRLSHVVRVLVAGSS